jgi:ATP-binding cassette subfamily B protein
MDKRNLWHYIKPYIPYAIFAALFMVGEVSMDLLQPSLMSRIVDEGVLGQGGVSLVVRLGLAMIVLVLFGGLCGSLNNVFVHMTAQNAGNDIRKDCFRSIMSFSFPQMDRFGTGSLVTRVTNDITQVQNFYGSFIRGLIRTSMLTLGSIGFLYHLNHQFGIITLCAFPFLVGALALCLRKSNPLLPKLQAQLDVINEIMQEDVSGVRIIKACVREVYEKLRFQKANDQQIKTQLQVLVIFAFMNPVMNGLMYLVVVLVLISGARQVGAGTATPGTIMAAITYTTQMLNGILLLVMLFQNITKGLASWKRIREILDTQPELADGSFAGETQVRGKVELRDVSFAFGGSSQEVLRHVNLTIQPGETVAVMGATGCGKTTLASLIPRFYDVTGGAVLVDNVDVRQYRQSVLREKIAVALQKSELFSISLADNIALGKPDATRQEIQNAAEIAQAEEFICRTPDGYDTLVAERGMSLSGGQKQRVSIARAVLKPAEILIFDDSTSALDLKTEANLYEALGRSKPDTTKIIIAQRVASARQADRIVVLSEGRIAACGTHEQLLRDCKTYQDIYYSQMGEEVTACG